MSSRRNDGGGYGQGHNFDRAYGGNESGAGAYGTGNGRMTGSTASSSGGAGSRAGQGRYAYDNDGPSGYGRATSASLDPARARDRYDGAQLDYEPYTRKSGAPSGQVQAQAHGSRRPYDEYDHGPASRGGEGAYRNGSGGRNDVYQDTSRQERYREREPIDVYASRRDEPKLSQVNQYRGGEEAYERGDSGEGYGRSGPGHGRYMDTGRDEYSRSESSRRDPRYDPQGRDYGRPIRRDEEYGHDRYSARDEPSSQWDQRRQAGGQAAASGWASLKGITNWKEIGQGGQAERSPPLDHSQTPRGEGAGSTLWTKLLGAAGKVSETTKRVVGREDGYASDKSDYEGETHITRVLKEHYLQHATSSHDLPDWLFDSHERGNSRVGPASHIGGQRGQHSSWQNRGGRDVAVSDDDGYGYGRRDDGNRGQFGSRNTIPGPTSNRATGHASSQSSAAQSRPTGSLLGDIYASATQNRPGSGRLSPAPSTTSTRAEEGALAGANSSSAASRSSSRAAERLQAMRATRRTGGLTPSGSAGSLSTITDSKPSSDDPKARRPLRSEGRF